MLGNFFMIVVLLVAYFLLDFSMRFFFKKVISPIANYVGGGIGARLNSKALKVSVITLELVTSLFWVFFQIYLYIINDYGRNSNYLFKWAIVTFIYLVLIRIYEAINKVNPFKLFMTNITIKFLPTLKKYYILNRMLLLFKQGHDLLKTLVILFLSLTFLISMKWPTNVYFSGFLFLPIYANYWVYFTKILTVNKNKEAVTIRRSLIYFILLSFVVFESFIRFQDFMSETITKPIDVNLFILTVSGVIYIALDRFLKEQTSDYLEFENKRRV
ncbi:hypothetical protein [Paenibacillus chitinolyticus]|uniref:hypothetical protein n=1 Tax=Paenibacillus chitinolyticus TaxID=79263 RepID=UPI00365D98C1